MVTYETAMKAGQYPVVAHGTSAEATKAKDTLSTLKPTQVTDHSNLLGKRRPVDGIVRWG